METQIETQYLRIIKDINAGINDFNTFLKGICIPNLNEKIEYVKEKSTIIEDGKLHKNMPEFHDGYPGLYFIFVKNNKYRSDRDLYKVLPETMLYIGESQNCIGGRLYTHINSWLWKEEYSSVYIAIIPFTEENKLSEYCFFIPALESFLIKKPAIKNILLNEIGLDR